MSLDSNSYPGRRLDALVFDHYGDLSMLQTVCDANPGVAQLSFIPDRQAEGLTWPERPTPTRDVAALWNGWGEGLDGDA